MESLVAVVIPRITTHRAAAMPSRRLRQKRPLPTNRGIARRVYGPDVRLMDSGALVSEDGSFEPSSNLWSAGITVPPASPLASALRWQDDRLRPYRPT